MMEIIFFTLLVVLAVIVLIVAIPLFIEYREVMRQQESGRIGARDLEYEQAVAREAEYFQDHPEEWIPHSR